MSNDDGLIRKPSLDLAEVGDRFILRKTNEAGEVSELGLSDEDILTLSQSMARLAQHVLAKQPPEVNSFSAFPVAKASLNTDHHQHDLHLEMDRRRAALSRH